MTTTPKPPTEAREQINIGPSKADVEDASETLARLGIDGVKWAESFVGIYKGIGANEIDRDTAIDAGWMACWFCNAINAGYDEANRRATPTTREVLMEFELALKEDLAKWDKPLLYLREIHKSIEIIIAKQLEKAGLGEGGE